jgi:CheY-like chemotaxis protein
VSAKQLVGKSGVSTTPLVALVVDDSMLIRHTVCRFFEQRGYRVEAASNGHDALEVLKRVQPDVIVTDMEMPKMGGKEFISALKGNSATENIPVLVVAGKQSSVAVSEQRATFTIWKDIDIEEQLAEALTRIMRA